MFKLLYFNPYKRNIKKYYDQYNLQYYINTDSFISYLTTVNINEYKIIKEKNYDKKFVYGTNHIIGHSAYKSKNKLYDDMDYYKRITNKFSNLKEYQQELFVRLFIFQTLKAIDKTNINSYKEKCLKYLVEISDTFETSKKIFFNLCINILKELKYYDYVKILKVIQMEYKLTKE